MELLLPVLFLILAIAWLVYKGYADAQRRKELADLARRLGLHFSPASKYDMDSCFPDFTCLHKGRDRHAFNIMTGQLNEREIIAFDYKCITGWGRNRQTHKFSAMIVNATFPLKPLYIRREEFFDKITEFFGADDIDFESAEFSRKFFVTSPDKKWAYDVIHQRMMEYLLAGPDCNIQFADNWIIAWQSFRFTPNDFLIALELIEGIVDRLPEYLVRQQTDQ